jgi:5-methylcytosine-specific restriction endonuclease McrA
MAYDKKKDYFKWKADCLIGGFKRRHKKHDKDYT